MPDVAEQGALASAAKLQFNDACSALEIAGGIGTHYRRMGRGTSVAGKTSKVEWQEFDMGAVFIQVLCLAMREDITHRYDEVSKAMDKQPDEDELFGWLNDKMPQGVSQVSTGTVTLLRPLRDVGGGMAKLEEVERKKRREIERRKYLAVTQIKEGLCKTWDRRTETGWEDRGVLRNGWDGHEKTAEALILLLTRLKKPSSGNVFSKESSERLRTAAQLVEQAMEHPDQ